MLKLFSVEIQRAVLAVSPDNRYLVSNNPRLSTPEQIRMIKISAPEHRIGSNLQDTANPLKIPESAELHRTSKDHRWMVIRKNFKNILWDINNQTQVSVLDAPFPDSLPAIRDISWNGKYALGYDGINTGVSPIALVWEVSTGKLIAQVPLPTIKQLRTLFFLPHSYQFAVGAYPESKIVDLMQLLEEGP